MATVTSTQNGNWSSGSTWVSGAVPQDEDSIVLEHEVTYDLGQTVLSFDIIYLNFGGKLIFPTTQSSDLYLLDRLEFNGGDLEIGTSGTPIPSQYKVNIFRSSSPNAITGNMLYGGYGTYNNTNISIYGDPAYYGSISDTELVSEWNTGSTITVSGDVTSAWNIGDLIHISNNDYNGSSIQKLPQDYASYTGSSDQYISRTVTIQSLSLNGANTDITLEESFNSGTLPFAIGSKVYYMSRNINIGNSYDPTSLNNFADLNVADFRIYRDVGSFEIDNVFIGIGYVVINSLPTLSVTNSVFISSRNLDFYSDQITYENNINIGHNYVRIELGNVNTSVQNNIFMSTGYLLISNNLGEQYSLGPNNFRTVQYLLGSSNYITIDSIGVESTFVINYLFNSCNYCKFLDKDSSILTNSSIGYLLGYSENCYIEITEVQLGSNIMRDSNNNILNIDKINLSKSPYGSFSSIYRSQNNILKGLTTYYTELVNFGGDYDILNTESKNNVIKMFINSNTISNLALINNSSNDNTLEIRSLAPSYSNGVFANSYGNSITGAMSISYSDFIKNPSNMEYIAEYLLLNDADIIYEKYNPNYEISYLQNGDTDWVIPNSSNPWILKVNASNITSAVKLSNTEMFSPVGVGSKTFTLSIYPTGYGTALDNTNIYVVLSYFNQIGSYRRTLLSSKNISQTFTNDQWNDIALTFTNGSKGPVYFNIYFENITDPAGHFLIDPAWVIY